MADALREDLAAAVTAAFGALKGKSENPHALSIYLRGCDCVVEQVDRGVPLASSIRRNFHTRLAEAIVSRMAEIGHVEGGDAP